MDHSYIYFVTRQDGNDVQIIMPYCSLFIKHMHTHAHPHTLTLYLWEQLVYSVMEQYIIQILYYYLINMVNIIILCLNFFSKSA